jgi:hypothetical protein
MILTAALASPKKTNQRVVIMLNYDQRIRLLEIAAEVSMEGDSIVDNARALESYVLGISEEVEESIQPTKSAARPN